MLEVELRASIVAGEDLAVVQDDCVDLVGAVELGPFVLVDDQREVGSAFVLARARLSWRRSAGFRVFLAVGESLQTLDCELAQAGDGLIMSSFLTIIYRSLSKRADLLLFLRAVFLA
jgi:hypothetical protein